MGCVLNPYTTSISSPNYTQIPLMRQCHTVTLIAAQRSTLTAGGGASATITPARVSGNTTGTVPVERNQVELRCAA
ncbi:hypothetical protein AMECASPLE_023460 [Ameca splendens]|uniref:Uncharacterized protein n=1 Tax=Ameca splendens TaxID=208324 RepID=A0ABV0ZCY6_9TELE